MSFWRKEVIDFALDQETLHHIEEQRAAIAQNPSDPRPFHNLAQLYRMQNRQEEALGLLLEAIRLDPSYAEAHVALAEIYVVRSDYGAAKHHAHAAERAGSPRAVDLLTRHGLIKPGKPGERRDVP